MFLRLKVIVEYSINEMKDHKWRESGVRELAIVAGCGSLLPGLELRNAIGGRPEITPRKPAVLIRPPVASRDRSRPGWRTQALRWFAGTFLLLGSAHAATTTVTRSLGSADSGTFVAGGSFQSWIAKGSLPIGSILRSVAVDARLESTNNGNWAEDLTVMIDPTPLAPGGDSILSIGNGDRTGPNPALTWANGYGGPGTSVTDTKSAPADFPATLDLHNAEVFIGNTWGGPTTGGTWSGIVSISYDSPDLALLKTFGLPGYPALIHGTNITWNLPYGANLTGLAPAYTLSSGTCDKPSGSMQNFTTPQTYTVTDGTVVNIYTVTVVIEPARSAIQVNIDTETRIGLAGPAGNLGATWNQVIGQPPLTASGLLDSAGAATTVGFTCDASNVDTWGEPALRLLKSGAFQWNWDDAYHLVLSGLTPRRPYSLYLASFHPNELGGRSVFSTANATTTVGTQIADTGGPDGNASTWVSGVNCVWFDNIVPDANNQITITIVGDSGTNAKRAYLNGFQLVYEGALAPQQLTATPGNAQVGLTWLPWDGATGYRVKRSLTSTGGYTTIATVFGLSFTDNSVVNGTTYYYVVSAVTSLGESVNSAEVSALPAKSAAKDMLTFGPGAVVVGNDIFWTVAAGTTVTSLAPILTVQPLAACSPPSGTNRNFTTPQTYTVTAEDGTSKMYRVTIDMADSTQTTNLITGFSFPGLGNATISGNWIRLSAAAGTPATALAPTYVLAAGATCTPASGSSRDFTNPQLYVVTGSDGTKRMYTVVVQPTVTLSLSGSPLAEAGGVATVTANLSAQHGRDVTVQLAFSGTAVMLDNYTCSATSIVIAAGQTGASIMLTSVPDTVYQATAKTIVVDASASYNATLASPQQVTAVITEDDPVPLFPLSAGQRGMVACRDLPAISYDAYLPPSYSSDGTPLPIIYTFNPGGGGMVADLQNVCASLQIILIGIINSSNDTTDDVIQRDTYAVARDVRQRLVYDPTAELAGGFSGGAVVAYQFARFRPKHTAGVLAMGGWLELPDGALPSETLPAGLLVARTTGNTDSGGNAWLGHDGLYLGSWNDVVKDWSFTGGHQVAPADIQNAALSWILNTRVKAAANDRATALTQGNSWRARIAAGDRQAVLREAVAVLMSQPRSWFAYQAQLVLDQLMADQSFRLLDTANLAQGGLARNVFYYSAWGAALNSDWQNYDSAMKALAGITSADTYLSNEIYALLGLAGYPVPVLRITQAAGQLGFSINKDTLGLTYTMQTCPNLASGVWQDMPCIPVETNTAWSTNVVPPTGAKNGFYRVRVTPSRNAVP